MIKHLIFFFILISLSAGGFAQTNTVKLVENGNITREISLIKKDGVRSEAEQLVMYYADAGYFDANVETGINEVFKVTTGERYRIKDVDLELEGDTVFNAESLTGEFYSSGLIEQQLIDEYDQLVESGYQEAKISIKELDVDSVSKTVSITVTKETGKLTQLNKVIFNGNRINSQRYLTRIAGFQDSLIASRKNLNELMRSLASSELLEEVSEPLILKEKERFVVLFTVQERNLNQLDGLIGFVPDSEGKGQVVGDLDISLWNVLREGNAFDLQYQRLKPETSRLELGISQHWIANIPLSIGLDFSFYQNDTTYQTRNIGLNSSYAITPNLNLDGRIYSQASNSSKESLMQQEPDGEKQGADLGFTFSNLDRIEVPKKGIYLKLMYGVASKDIENDSSLSFRQQRIEFDSNIYFSIGSQSVIAGTLQGFYVLGGGITESDLVRFGGANSFRGYSEEQFRASELVWGDVEYRFLTDRNSYLFMFTAAGYYNRTRLETETNASFVQSDFLYSGGLGLSYKTAIGRLKFTYALSPSETIGNGKVHFGIQTSF
jgi:outer membrane protein assembly factor BamA